MASFQTVREDKVATQCNIEMCYSIKVEKAPDADASGALLLPFWEEKMELGNRIQIVYKSIDELKPYANNPRNNKKAVAAVANSIKSFGFKIPIVIDKNNEIVCGHTRILAAKQLEIPEVPCIYADDLNEEEIRAFRLADNKTAELASWNTGMLATELNMIVNFSMADFGFDQAKGLVSEDTFDDKVPVESISRRGDIWCLGRHRLMCGDATSVDDVHTLLGDKLADMYITDPPYNVDYTGKTKDALKIQNDTMEDEKFRAFLAAAFFAANSVMKPGATFYIWHADSEGYNFRGACHDIGWKVRQCLIWKKNVMVMGRQDYQWKHEPCQPAGTMVWTPNGDVPIESLKDGDEVIAFNVASGQVCGYRDGIKVKTASRLYSGEMYSISAGGNTTRATDNHQFSVRFNPDTSEKFCTYLMQRGNRWRVGITRTYDARGFGLKHRIIQENAERGWLIETFESRSAAQMGEQLLSVKYGIPYTHWEVERGLSEDNYNHRTKKEIDWLYDQIDYDLDKRAEQLLSDYGRSIKYPLVDEDSAGDKFSRRVTAKVNACNLIAGLMQVPVPYRKTKFDGSTFEWVAIERVTRERFDGRVYSLSVPKFEHYISDGIITHNCLYGWKDGATHLWAADRKQTTILEFDRPSRSKEHTTMKPVRLFDYQIQNNTKEMDVVFDSFAGSGTSIIACEQNNRICYSLELDPRYVDVIVRRYRNLVGEEADITLMRDGETIKYSDLVDTASANQ